MLNDAQFADALRSFRQTAFRLELQPAYAEPIEEDTVRRFLAGDPQPPTEVPGLREWFEQVATITSQGKRIERVRVHEDPPTPYQQWERWAGKWNIKAGEVIRYMTRTRAHEVGLLPAATDVDWWLLDSSQLIAMRFDNGGRRTATQLVTESASVVQACSWWDLAANHSTPDDARREAAG